MNMGGGFLHDGTGWQLRPDRADIPSARAASASSRDSEWAQSFAQTTQVSVLLCYGNASTPEPLAALVRAAGHRVLDMLPVDAAADHLSRLITLDAAIVRCSGEEPGLEALLARLDAMAAEQDIALLVITGLAGLDRVDRLIQSRTTLLLCDPEPTDITAALASLSWPLRREGQLHDIGREQELSPFDRLSDQLLRLNRMVETLVQDKTAERDSGHRVVPMDAPVRSPGRSYTPPPRASETASHHGVRAHQVRAVLKARRLRDTILAPDLFADPAWDILLDLLAARLENSRVSVSSLCIAASVPPTTALRWIRQLTDRGLLDRQADPKDGRRIYITLSEAGMEAILRWFEESRTHLHTASKPSESPAPE